MASARPLAGSMNVDLLGGNLPGSAQETIRPRTAAPKATTVHCSVFLPPLVALYTRTRQASNTTKSITFWLYHPSPATPAPVCSCRVVFLYAHDPNWHLADSLARLAVCGACAGSNCPCQCSCKTKQAHCCWQSSWQARLCSSS